ncbi:hypothetical protein, partial [Cloacibacillus porcorum]
VLSFLPIVVWFPILTVIFLSTHGFILELRLLFSFQSLQEDSKPVDGGLGGGGDAGFQSLQEDSKHEAPGYDYQFSDSFQSLQEDSKRAFGCALHIPGTRFQSLQEDSKPV